MPIFRQSSLEGLPVSIAGVKLGDRLLVLGCRDPRLIAKLAIKSGLTGRACAVDSDEGRAKRGAEVVAREGALVETFTAPWTALPFDADAFDVAVVHGVFPSLTQSDRAGAIRDLLRVLRPGGRCLIIDPAPRTGIAALIPRRLADPAYTPESALSQAGFKAVRTVASRDGVLFVEGVRENR